MRTMLFLGCVVSLLPGPALCQGVDKDHFEKKIRPVLVTHCYSCHDGDAPKPKGDFRIDKLATNLADGAAREAWQIVLKRVQTGEMPPKGKPRPSEKETQVLLDWISGEHQGRRSAPGPGRRVSFCAGSIVPSTRTRCAICSASIVELKEMLPMDSSSAGFDNVADALHISSFLMDKYLEAADKALSRGHRQRRRSRR